jgi:hypothetical protein
MQNKTIGGELLTVVISQFRTMGEEQFSLQFLKLS